MTQYTDANKDLTKCGKIKEEFRGHTVPTIEQSRAAAVRVSRLEISIFIVVSVRVSRHKRRRHVKILKTSFPFEFRDTNGDDTKTEISSLTFISLLLYI